MNNNQSPARWRYDRGEGRLKHRWGKLVAGFEPGNRGAVGKCPCDVTQEEAEAALNAGLPLPELAGGDHPRRIYAVFRGVIYEAVPTVPGVSYHAYPWRGDLPGRSRLPRTILAKLEQQALESGHWEEFKTWLRRYGG